MKIHEWKIGGIYAWIFRPNEGTVRLDGMLILDEHQKPASYVGGPPITFAVDRSRKDGVKKAVTLVACQGEGSRLTTLSLDRVFLLDEDSFKKVLQKFGVEPPPADGEPSFPR